jgi:hypothetical protein
MVLPDMFIHVRDNIPNLFVISLILISLLAIMQKETNAIRLNKSKGKFKSDREEYYKFINEKSIQYHRIVTFVVTCLSILKIYLASTEWYIVGITTLLPISAYLIPLSMYYLYGIGNNIEMEKKNIEEQRRLGITYIYMSTNIIMLLTVLLIIPEREIYNRIKNYIDSVKEKYSNNKTSTTT